MHGDKNQLRREPRVNRGCLHGTRKDALWKMWSEVLSSRGTSPRPRTKYLLLRVLRLRRISADHLARRRHVAARHSPGVVLILLVVHLADLALLPRVPTTLNLVP
jgi:hypothetical protein